MSNAFVTIKVCYVYNQWYDIPCATLYICTKCDFCIRILMFNFTTTVWTLVLFSVLAATAAGTTATVGKFSVPFFLDTSRLLVLVMLAITVARCADCSVSDLKYPNCSTAWRVALWATACVPGLARQFQWFALLGFRLVKPSSPSKTHSSEHKPKYE